jgi:hypothetical protein
MRIQEIYEKLVAAKIDEPFANFSAAGAITKIQELRNRLELLVGIPGFEKEENLVKASIIFRTSNQQINIPEVEWSVLVGDIRSYAMKLQGLKKYLEAELNQQNPEAIFVKLPPSEDLREIIQFETKIATVMEQLVLIEGVGGSLKLKSWEKGSLWFELAVGGPLVVAYVGSAVWAGAVIFKKIQEGKIFAEHAKGLNLKNESMENLVDAQKKMLDMLIEAEAKNIASQNLQGEVSPDTLERIKFSIKELAELIEKGTEIHAALNAPEKVQNLFPNFKKLPFIESATKLLEGNK